MPDPADRPSPRHLLQEGILHHQAGRHPQAHAAYHAAHVAAPDMAEPLRLLGILAHQRGRHDSAVPLLFEACQRCPDDAGCRVDLGIALAAAGDLPAARECLRQAVAMQPADAHSRVNLAQILLRPGPLGTAVAEQVAEAERHVREAIRLSPGLAAAHSALGAALREQGRLAEAEAALRAAQLLDPESAQVSNNLGNVLGDRGVIAAAEAAYRQALARDPALVEAHNNLGRLLRQRDQLAAAEASLRTALRLKPDCVDAQVNLGNVLADLGRYTAAEASYTAALALAPAHADARYDLGALHLVTGRLESGWQGYAARWQRRGFSPREMAAPAWEGEPLGGRTLLLHAEQGYGDTIQFSRFIPELATQGRLILEAPAALLRLLGSLPCPVHLIAAGEVLPAHDLQLALPSLPGVLGIGLTRIPGAAPYLAAEPDALAAWQLRLAPLPGLRVGLAWAGNPDYALDRRRSIDPRMLDCLASVPGVSFVSLQMLDAAAAPAWMHDFTEDLRDFADTAALVTALDLVISVDTGVVHLAGALGRPTWLLNRFDTCWRWLLGRTDSPWYPTLRIFRQPAPFDWPSVLALVAGRLAALAARTGDAVAAEAEAAEGRIVRYSAA